MTSLTRMVHATSIEVTDAAGTVALVTGTAYHLYAGDTASLATEPLGIPSGSVIHTATLTLNISNTANGSDELAVTGSPAAPQSFFAPAGLHTVDLTPHLTTFPELGPGTTLTVTHHRTAASRRTVSSHLAADPTMHPRLAITYTPPEPPENTIRVMGASGPALARIIGITTPAGFTPARLLTIT